MPRNADSCLAYDYADRICRRLPGRLHDLLKAAGMSKYALAKKSGVSLEMICKIERGDSIPTVHVEAQLAYGLGMSQEQFAHVLEMKTHADAS